MSAGNSLLATDNVENKLPSKNRVARKKYIHLKCKFN